MTSIFELALIIGIAAVLGVIARQLRQPVILAYLATGALIGYFGWLPIEDRETYHIFADLGIMFLLFLVGLEVNFASLKLVGKASVVIGLGQVVFTSILGFIIASALGFGTIPAAYIAIALTFSSTIIIVKLLSEKRDLNSLYGKIAIGIMLVQDLIAILLLIALAGIGAEGGNIVATFAWIIAKGVLFIALMMIFGRKLLPIVFDSMARSQELLFLSSLAWVFAVVAFVEYFGFSIEIGGFLAGIALANSAENFQIVSRIRSLRDFFLLIFFVILGSSLATFDLTGLFQPIIALSLFVLIGNPLVVLILMGALGYRRRTSFLTGVTVAQISEFSLVLVALGARLGHIDERIVALVTAIGVVTITTSTYLIVYGDHLARRLHLLLGIFERRASAENDLPNEQFRKDIIIIGAGRMGESILKELPKESVLVLDFDPDIMRRLRHDGYTAAQGDIADDELWEKIDLTATKLVISTSPDIEDNSGLLEKLVVMNYGGKKVLRAETTTEANMLYEHGADYVLLPYISTGHFFGKNLVMDMTGNFLTSLKKRDRELLP